MVCWQQAKMLYKYKGSRHTRTHTHTPPDELNQSSGRAELRICLKSVLFSRKEGDSCLLAWRILCRVVGSIGWPKMRKYSFCTPIEGAWHVSFLFFFFLALKVSLSVLGRTPGNWAD